MSKTKTSGFVAAVFLAALTTAAGISGNANLIPIMLGVDGICALYFISITRWYKHAPNGVSKFSRAVLSVSLVFVVVWGVAAWMIPAPDVSLVFRQNMADFPFAIMPGKTVYLVVVSPKPSALTEELKNRTTENMWWPDNPVSVKCGGGFARSFEITNTGSKDAIDVSIKMAITLLEGTNSGTQSGVRSDARVFASFTHRLVMSQIFAKETVSVVVVNESHRLWLKTDLPSIATVKTPGSMSDFDVPLVRALVNFLDAILPLTPTGPSPCPWSGVGAAD